MTVFTMNDLIFAPLLKDAGVDKLALQNFIDAINQNSYSNAAVGAASLRGDSVFQLVSSEELHSHNAGAMYSNDRGSDKFQARGDRFAFQLNESWFKSNGSEPAFLADPRNARAVLGVVTHEVDHNAHQSMYDDALRLRDTPLAACRPDLTPH